MPAGFCARASAPQTMLDQTVTAALTLAQVALASGDRVGLLAYGRRAAAARRAGPRRRVICATLVEALALVHSDGVEADHAAAAATVMAAQKRRALVVWLTDVADTAGVPDVIEQALRMAPRARRAVRGHAPAGDRSARGRARQARRRRCSA